MHGASRSNSSSVSVLEKVKIFFQKLKRVKSKFPERLKDDGLEITSTVGESGNDEENETEKFVEIYWFEVILILISLAFILCKNPEESHLKAVIVLSPLDIN